MLSSYYKGSNEPELYSKEVSEALLKTNFKIFNEINDEILISKKIDRTIFTAGNGGSSATASHMINDLVKGCRVEGREGFRAICLNDSTALVTCLANDFSYKEIYSITLRTLAKPGDLLIVFSGSGNSPNILLACETAKMMGITVIGFGGRDGGKMKALCDYFLLAPTDSMEQIEDLHMIYIHSLICGLREKLKYIWDIEIINYPQRNNPKYAIFDFDGTISLIREGWQPIMYEYFIEEILKCPNATDKGQVKKTVVDFVDFLTGKQTIFQCMRLSEEILRYGGNPKDPLEYKSEYLRRLLEHIKQRKESLRKGGDPLPYLVPGVKDVLEKLKEMGIDCYLTSGTDEIDVKEEAELLKITDYFKSIHGATDTNNTVCSKEEVLNELINNKSIKGSELITFGDGFVEIELAKNVGGYAVAVATNEEKKNNSVNHWKRNRLLKAGADCVIPDFKDTRRLLNFIWGEENAI
jgi:phosphoheptose isomerase/phosphoglycolate phosphatase-like HAD superfamily hydrolase